jgi:hypothetical protein
MDTEELDLSPLNAVNAMGDFVIGGGESGIYRAWDLRKGYAVLVLALVWFYFC